MTDCLLTETDLEILAEGGAFDGLCIEVESGAPVVEVGRGTRFLNNNFITGTSLLTLSSMAKGRITALRRTGTGASMLSVTGQYSGIIDRDYYVEIQTTGEVGVATYKWSQDDGVSFVATGVVTTETAASLNNGLSIAFSRATGQDCVSGDVWRFRAYLPWGLDRMLDRDRDTEFRTQVATPVTATINMGSAKTPTVLVLVDHNLSSAASLRLEASSDNFVSIAEGRWIPIRSGTIVHYLGGAAANYQYWRLGVSDPSNLDGYIRWSELYLGTYYQTPRRLELGDVLERQRVVQRDRAVTGRWINGVPKLAKVLEVRFDHLPEDDRDTIFEAFEDLFDTTLFRTGPVLFHPDSADPATLVLAQWSQLAQSRSERASPERYQMDMRFFEIPRTI